MEQYMVLGIHLEKESATAVMWDIFSMDHHGEHVNLMVPGVDSNLPVKVSTTLNGITYCYSIIVRNVMSSHSTQDMSSTRD